nr:PREDICTED: uncharacterized protein LOC103281534 [Anolis carolinensis]|eukprot:XP_008121512.1 PREDICTED: uncharacterized protein LOC103281534 [Anolis carolinensis]
MQLPKQGCSGISGPSHCLALHCRPFALIAFLLFCISVSWKAPGSMSSAGIHQGYLRKYGGFLFKQWKEKFLLLSVDGSLLVCPDAHSPAEMGIALGSGCQDILEGGQIRDLPPLPLGAQRDSCLGLRLRRGKVLLLLAPDRQQCTQWLNILRKVKEGFSFGSPSRCKLHIDSPGRKSCRKEGSLGESGGSNGGSPSREGSGSVPCSPHCLRHGPCSRPGVKAACILVGGAAAGPSMGYMVTSAGAGHPAESHLPDFKELGYHPSACDAVAEAHYESLDCEGLDHDFDSMLDFGGFAF